MSARRIILGGALSAALFATSTLIGQSINVDFGTAASVPPASYGGVAAPGVWNAILGDQFVNYTNFVDLAGAPTSITMTNIGGSDLLTVVPPIPQAERSLLSDFLVTFTPTLETCLFFHGLENGTYRVTTYAWHPGDPAISSFVTVDQSAAGGAVVGGDWTGTLENGVHYSEHIAVVTSGDLYLHSGIPAGGSPVIAALNGLQFELLPPPGPNFVRGDSNDDALVDIADAIGSLGVLFLSEPNSCSAALDANDDGGHDIADPIHMLAFLFTSGAAPVEPYPNCGEDGTIDLDCDQYLTCP